MMADLDTSESYSLRRPRSYRKPRRHETEQWITAPSRFRLGLRLIAVVVSAACALQLHGIFGKRVALLRLSLRLAGYRLRSLIRGICVRTAHWVDHTDYIGVLGGMFSRSSKD
jgi:hypothetical protein